MWVAMIGAGNIGSKHLSTLAGEPDVELVGIVRPTQRECGRRRKSGAGDPIPGWKNGSGRSRSTPPESASPVCARGYRSRIDCGGHRLFVEKPLPADRATAEALAAALECSRVMAAVGYHWRAMDTIPEVRAAITENPPRLILAHGTMPLLTRMSPM